MYVLVGHGQIVGPYTGIDYATDYTNPDEGAPCDMTFVNASIGDADFINGAAEVPMGWSFSGTWNSGVTYFDGPGEEVLLVSLHTYTESWRVALRLSDGSTTATLDYDLTLVTSNATGTLASCGIIYGGPYNYERPSQLLDFADYVIPPGEGVIGIIFEPFADGAANPDPHGVIVLEGTEAEPPCDDLVTDVSSVEFCLGGEVTLTAESTHGGTITWSDGYIDGEAFRPDAAGIHTFTATSDHEDDCEFTIDILVNDLPEILAIADDSLLCVGEEVVFTGDGAVSYVWDLGVVDGVAFIPAATAIYTATGTDVNGCVNSDDVLVEVVALPPVDAGPDHAICIEETTVLVGAGAGVDGEYIWDRGVVDGEDFAPVETESYTLTGTDENGCVNTDEVIVTVNPLPVINAGMDEEICIGDEITLSGLGVEVGDEIAWDRGIIDGVPFAPTETATYVFTVTSAEGCISSDAMVVTVHPLPEVEFTEDDTIGCEPFTVQFTSFSSDEAIYSWSFGDGDNGVGANVLHTYEGVGLYDVRLTVTSTEGCVDSDTYNEYIEVIPQPEAIFTYNPLEDSEFNYTYVFVNRSMDATIYSWNFGDGSPSVFEENPAHEFPQTANGTYYVELTATNDIGCVSKAQQIIKITKELVFYIPNAFTPDGDPFNNTFKPIFTMGLDVYDYHLTIYNRWGEMVFESFDANFGWDGSYGNGGLVDDGSYIWIIEFGEVMSDKKHIERGNVTILK